MNTKFVGETKLQFVYILFLPYTVISPEEEDGYAFKHTNKTSSEWVSRTKLGAEWALREIKWKERADKI